MRVLVYGSGAREHALAWRLSKEGAEVIVGPGNGGTAEVARNVPVDLGDVRDMVARAKTERVDLAVVGPEAPLVAGVVDKLRAAGIRAFGPSKTAAQLEGSKVFSKRRMEKYGVPTAAFRVFDDADRADVYIRSAARPLVVKADGLAAGKGVVVASGADEALDAIDRIMRKKEFGDAGASVVIEEQLVGEEVSYHVVSDGERYVALAPAQDHKRIFDGDRGPNTGGMGAYSPPPIVTPAVERRILAEVVEPTLSGMRADKAPFRGALFVGLMIVDGAPMVLEYNVRFGDPECEVLMARYRGSMLELLDGAARGDLSGVTPEWEAPAALSIVLAAGGYPGAYEKGKPITGLDAAAKIDHVQVFHAGTAREGDAVVTAGGRVLTVTSVGKSIDEAAERAYRAADTIRFDGVQMRRDIGWRARTRA